MYKEDKNNFIRILKEVGLYTQWVKERKKIHLLNPAFYDVFSECASIYFGSNLYQTILFRAAEKPKMWTQIADLYYDVKCSEILNNQAMIKDIKWAIEIYNE